MIDESLEYFKRYSHAVFIILEKVFGDIDMNQEMANYVGLLCGYPLEILELMALDKVND